MRSRSPADRPYESARGPGITYGSAAGGNNERIAPDGSNFLRDSIRGCGGGTGHGHLNSRHAVRTRLPGRKNATNPAFSHGISLLTQLPRIHSMSAPP